jgi:hypothetical protein
LTLGNMSAGVFADALQRSCSSHHCLASAVIVTHPSSVSRRLAFLTSGYTSTVFTWAP